MYPSFQKIVALLLIIVIALAQPTHAAPKYRPGKEYRSLNTGAYEIAIQKNGRIDISLANGIPVILNAFPMVWFADKKKPEVIKLDGRYSQRFEVNDALGRGQGMRIRYKDVQWTFRAYPTKPYLAVQLAYINSKKKAVQIKQLTPWAIGDPKKGGLLLGPGTRDSTMLLDGIAKESTPLATLNGAAPNMIALFNPETKRSLIAGFTTQVRAINTLHIQHIEPDADETTGNDQSEEELRAQINYMRATNTYDPPITVQPGEILESEILYLAITESDPLLALERYAKAVAVTNKIPVYSKPPPRNIFLPNQYDTEREYRAVLMNAAHHIKENVISTQQIRFIISDFPNAENPVTDQALGEIANELRAMGFLVGFFNDPFQMPTSHPITRQHPDWFTQNTESDWYSDRLRIDINNQDARTWFINHHANRKNIIQFDSLWYVDLSAYLTRETQTQAAHTKIETIRLAMNTLRAAVGARTPIVLAATDLLPTFPNTHTLEFENYHSTFLQHPHLGHRYTITSERPTSFQHTQAAVMGINLIETMTSYKTAWNRDQNNDIFSPPLIRPAKPQDLFYTNDPSIWLKRANTSNGHWILAGINNNTDTTKTTTLPINNPKIRNQPLFTIFDLQQQRYYGQSKSQININVPPNQMRTLLLREYKKVPLLLGSTLPISETLPSDLNEKWDPTTQTLTGTITTTQTQGTLHFFQPPGYKITAAKINNTPVEWTNENNTLTLNINPTPNTPTTYTLTFTR